MKKVLYYFLHFIIFIIGIYPGFVYAWLEPKNPPLTYSVVYKYGLINSLFYFLSLIVALLLLKQSQKKERDFRLIGIMYGVASLMYDVTSVKVIGGILLIATMLKIYFRLFPNDKFWERNRKNISGE
jgi:hypothetical protein